MKRAITALAAAAMIAGAAQAADLTLLNASYDPTRELYAHLSKAFAERYTARSGRTIEIKTSNAGSGNLHAEIHVTSIFVTHDQEEALEVADRVVVMDKGRIEQAGTPQQVYDHPRTSFVHGFIGEAIVVPVAIEAGEVRFDGAPIGIDPQGHASGPASLFVRPFDMTILPTSCEHALKGVVRRIHGIGPARRVEIALGRDGAHTTVEVVALRNQQWRIGQVVGLRPEQYRLFAE
jgi:sulfate transport system ATP-binding protein